MKNYIRFASLILLLSFHFSLSAQDGEKIFKANCGACHTVGKGRMTGPDLKKVDERHDLPWLMKWIKSSQSVVKSNDTSAVRLFNQFNHITMPDQALKDDEITAVLGYIKKTGEPAPVVASSDPTTVVASATPVVLAKTTGSPFSLFTPGEYVLLILTTFMAFIILALSRTIRTLTEQKNPKQVQ